MAIDETDKKIIKLLQNNGRLSNIEIAEMVNLSHSSCSRRISRLEKDNYITGYRALSNRKKLGYSIRAFCGVIRESHVPWKDLADRLSDNEYVVSVFAVSGEVDILLEIIAEDMKQFSDVILKDIFDTPGVSATRSTFVLDEVKSLY